MSWTPAERNRLRDSFFYDELVPRRTAMLQIDDRIALVNERGLARAEDRLAQSSGNLRRTLIATFSITLAGGLVLALLTIGCGLLLATWWPMILLVPTLILVQQFVIRPEERYLRRRFGTQYEAYTRRVRRWL